MATAYRTNQFPTAPDQHRTGLIVVTCILDEGAVTPASAGTVLGTDGLLQPGYTFTVASQLSKDDYVEFKIDTGVTYAATHGRPVITAVESTTGVYGKIISEPQATTNLTQLTTAVDADTLAERLSGGYYRYAQVAIFANACERFLTDSSTILVGSDLLYDVSDGDWCLGAGSNHGVISAHYSTTAEEYVLGFYQLTVVPSQA